MNTEATCIIAANSSDMYRNLFSVGKISKLDDGLIDIFILKAKNPVAFFYEFIRILFGIKKDSKRALYFKTPNLAIINNFALCHIDGEKTKLKDNIELTVFPKSLKVFC